MGMTNANKAAGKLDDCESDVESFFSLLQSNQSSTQETQPPQQQPPPTSQKNDLKSAALVQHAARLELESITLKETLDVAIEEFRKAPVAEIGKIASSTEKLQKEVAAITAEHERSQASLPLILDEWRKFKDDVSAKLVEECSNTLLQPLLQSSTALKENVSLLTKNGEEGQQIYEKGLELHRNIFENQQGLEKTVGGIRKTVGGISKTVGGLEKTVGVMEKSVGGLEKSVGDIKRFLQLVIPRLISIENAVAQQNVEAEPERGLKKRKLV
ncbi:uncharacterized protein LODBEIA_P53460 [Lodderomyces beijingensis]|uniref:Uncharacterized protein n=1 Tax=Lodderomyces beijingensis TaxID=1775926 RepID=A0ABP0ZUV0_9ASCO